MGEESVYKLLIKTMKEMEKRGYIGFLKTKVLSFPTLKARVCITLIGSLCHASQLCAGKCALDSAVQNLSIFSQNNPF